MKLVLPKKASIATVHVLAGCLLLILIGSIQPRGYDARYKAIKSKGKDVQEAKWNNFQFPLEFRSKKKPETVEVQFSVDLRDYHGSALHVYPDDCLTEGWINGKEIPKLSVCGSRKGGNLELGKHVKLGKNTITLHLRNTGGAGGLRFHLSKTNPWKLLLQFLILCTVVSFGWFFKNTLKLQKHYLVTYWIFTTGILMRILYVMSTNYNVRGHDTTGHIKYIEYIRENLHMPPTKGGWSYYHPPLYYYYSAFWMELAALLGFSHSQQLVAIQIGSCILSSIALTFGILLGIKLFTERKNRWALWIYSTLLALSPGLIFFASRINNDALLYVSMAAVLYFLVSWWQKSRKQDLMWCFVFLAIGMLTKSNILLLLPSVFLCILLRKKMQKKERIRLIGLGLIFLFFSTGWFYLYRFAIEDNKSIVGNRGSLHSGLKVDNSIETLFEFNPARVVQIPFNSPWSDAKGRNNFWEYYWRSAHFGEFAHNNLEALGSIIILLSLLVGLMGFYGIYALLKKRDFSALPLLLTFFIVLLGHVARRQMSTYSPTQDFRYTPIALTCLAYFIGITLLSLSPKYQKYARYLLLIYLALCALFILLLVLQ